MKAKNEKARYFIAGLFFLLTAAVMSIFFLLPIDLHTISIFFIGGFSGIAVMYLLRFKELQNIQKNAQ